MSDQEMESKFYLSTPQDFSERISKLGARLVSARTNEWNLRFDTPSGSLTSAGQALRLRKDQRNRLTYKGQSALDSEVTSRQELEIEVSDFETTRKILEALGYQVAVMYEKYRTTWHYKDAEIVLDELPIGVFCEIEGHNVEQIREIAVDLGLSWEKRISTSYLGIFSLLKAQLDLKVDHLTFGAMREIKVNHEDLSWIHIFPADA